MAEISGIVVNFGEYEELIHNVSDKSDENNNRMWVTFLNGYTLSILGENLRPGLGVQACGNTYEIALWGLAGNLVSDFFPEGSTMGFVDPEEIAEFAEKICEL